MISKMRVEKLNSATSDVDSLVSRIANHQLVKNRDSLNFAVISGKKYVMRSGGRVTIPYGVDSQPRSNSYSVENVGFELAVQPDVTDDQVVLRFEASKTGLENKIVSKSAYDVGVKGTVRVEQHSDFGVLVLSGDENDVKKVEDLISQTLPGLPSLKTFEFQSTMVCTDGQASAALFCESDRNWMLIVRRLSLIGGDYSRKTAAPSPHELAVGAKSLSWFRRNAARTAANVDWT